MFKTLTKKTKMWIGIAGITMAILLISLTALNRGKFFSGALTIVPIPAPSGGLRITRVSFNQHAYRSPTTDYVTIAKFKIKNEDDVTYTLQNIRIKLTLSAGTASELRSKMENLHLKLAGTNETCTAVIGNEALNSSNIAHFNYPFGSGSSCYPAGISLAANAEKTLVVEAKFLTGANSVFRAEIEDLTGFNSPGQSLSTSLSVISSSTITGPYINIDPDGFRIAKRDNLITETSIASPTDNYVPIMKVELANNTLGEIGIDRMKFKIIFLEGESTLRPNLEEFRLSIPSRFGCTDGTDYSSMGAADIVIFRADNFTRGADPNENCDFNDAIDFSAGQTEIFTLSAKFRAGADGRIQAKILDANAFETQFNDTSNLFVLASTPLNGPTIEVIGPTGITVSQEETTGGTLSNVGETEALKWRMELRGTASVTLNDLTVQVLSDLTADEFSTGTSGLFQEIKLITSNPSQNTQAVIDSGAGTATDPHLLKFSGITLSETTSYSTSYRLKIRLKPTAPAGKHLTFQIPVNDEAGNHIFIPHPTGVTVNTLTTNPAGFYAKSGEFTTAQGGINVMLNELTQTTLEDPNPTNGVTVLSFTAQSNNALYLHSPTFTFTGNPTMIDHVAMTGFDDDDDYNPARNFAVSGNTIAYDGNDMKENLEIGIAETFELKVFFKDTASGLFQFSLAGLDRSIPTIPFNVTFPLQGPTFTVGAPSGGDTADDTDDTADDDDGTINPPGSGTTVTARSETITPTPSSTMYRDTEVEVLKFSLESSSTVDLNTITFHLTPGADTTLPRTRFQEFKLMRENATLVTSSGNQLSNFRNIGDLTLAIPTIGRNLPATQRKTYSLFAKLTADAPLGNSFKIQLDGVQTSPAVTLSGAPVVSTKFTVEAQQTSGGGTTTTTNAQQQQIQELQQQISLLQQQLMQALQSQDASAAAEIAETLESLIAAQNQITENQEASSQQRIIGTDPLLGLEDLEEEIETIRETFPPPPPRPQPQSFTPPPATVDSGQVRGVAATDSFGALGEPTLVSTPRIRTAPERGDTGPEVLIYLGVLAASQGIYIWRKRKAISSASLIE